VPKACVPICSVVNVNPCVLTFTLLIVAGVLLFYYIVRLVCWWRPVFIGISVRSPCALMWIGLYCRSRQFVVSVWVQFARWPPTLFVHECETAQSTETTGRSIGRLGESPSDELDRCDLTRLVRRVLVCGLHSSDAFWRRLWTDVWYLFCAPEVDTAEVVVDCSWVLNRVVICRRSVEFVTVNNLWTQSELLSSRQRRLSSVSVYLWAKVVRPLIATWWLVRPSTASLFAVGE